MLNEEIKLEKVSSVYSGKAGKCCCGCSGNHRYASAHRQWASKNRGYSVTDEDVNDQQVKKVVNLFNVNPADVEVIDNYTASLTLGGRDYVVYLKSE